MSASRLVQTQDPLRVLVHHPRDAQRRRDLQQIRHQPLVQASDALVPDRLVCHVPDARVPGRVHARALRLQPRPQHVQRIHDGRPKGPGRGAHDARHQRAGLGVLLVAALGFRSVRGVGCLQELEGAHVDGRVREHAEEAHGHAAVGRAGPALCVHLAECLDEQRVAARPVGDIFRLQSAWCCSAAIWKEAP